VREQSPETRKMGGFSLIELLITLGLFTLVVGSVAFFATDSFRASRNAQMRIRAMAQIQESSNAIIMNKDSSWATILSASDGSVKHIEYAGGHYTFADGSAEHDGISLSITVNDVNRDVNGDIVPSGGTVDYHSKMVSITATWIDILGNLQEIESEFFLNDWATLGPSIRSRS
jgi:Tfp pilus assembly protein PilV